MHGILPRVTLVLTIACFGFLSIKKLKIKNKKALVLISVGIKCILFVHSGG